jgi:SAM-dependent methyltransferase
LSGFSPAWLALREPADHAARDPGLLSALSDALQGREALEIVDLGCGTGSNLRAVALALPTLRQTWRLVDHDPALLAAARDRLAAWAESAEGVGDRLELAVAGRALTVTFAQADLRADLDGALGERPDLVTAAALFDLASEAFIARVAAAVAARGAAFYTALTYDGREEWRPPHQADGEVHRAFLAHQRRDKGFGPAAGPDATAALARAFREAGYRVGTGESPWRLGPGALLDELAAGVAGAARETGLVPEERIAAWLAARRSGATPGLSCLVGHLDLLALPPA